MTISHVQKEIQIVSRKMANHYLHYDVEQKDGSITHVKRLWAVTAAKHNHNGMSTPQGDALKSMTAVAKHCELVDQKLAKPTASFKKLVEKKKVPMAVSVIQLKKRLENDAKVVTGLEQELKTLNAKLDAIAAKVNRNSQVIVALNVQVTRTNNILRSVGL